MYKRLYVVSSIHLGANREINIASKVEDLLEVRLRFIESLARKLRVGSYFSDGVYDLIAKSMNWEIQEATPRQIRMASQLSYMQGGDGFCMYEVGRVAELFAHLRRHNIRFTFKTTESEGLFERDLDQRDREIIKYVSLNGTRDNILFVGIDHKLQPLRDSELKWYRTNILVLDDIILGIGKVSKSLEPLKSLPRRTKSGMRVRWNLQYH